MRQLNLTVFQILFIIILVSPCWPQQLIAEETNNSANKIDNKGSSLLLKEEIHTLRTEHDNKISTLEKELGYSKRKGEYLEDLVNKNLRDYYEKLINTISMFSYVGTVLLGLFSLAISLATMTGYKKLKDSIKDAKDLATKEIYDAKLRYEEITTDLKKEKETISDLALQTKAQIDYMQGIDILRNTNTSEESLLRAIYLLKSSIDSYGYDITRVSLAAAYKYMGNYQAAFSQFQNLSEPDQLSSEGAAAFLEIAVLIGNKTEFDRVDSKYNDTLKGFENSLFLPLMEAAMAFLQGDTEEMNRLLEKNNRKIRTYIDDAIYEETRNGKKMFMWELNTLKTHLTNNYSTKKGFQELKEHMDLLENRECQKTCVNSPG